MRFESVHCFRLDPSRPRVVGLVNLLRSCCSRRKFAALNAPLMLVNGADASARGSCGGGGAAGADVCAAAIDGAKRERIDSGQGGRNCGAGS